MAKIGRNEPCYCGSGKKYKKCCMGSNGNIVSQEALDDSAIEKNDDTIPVDAVIDYGQPYADDAFFEANDVHEISGVRLLYSLILNPYIETLANTAVRQVLSRSKEETDRIKKTDSVEILMEIMKKNPDPINYAPLIDKLVQAKEQAVPIILRELMEPQNDSFVELAVRILHGTGIDYSDEIIKIIRTGNNKRVYVISVLCVLIGFYDNNETEKLLWDYYHYMKNQYPHATYSDGPLLGLIEIQERKRERPLLN